MEVLEKDRLALVEEALSKGKEYQEYRERTHRLAGEGKTTGLEQSEAQINFAQLNDRRMQRWEKTFKLPEAVKEQLSKLDPELVFLVLTESWCGDAAASLPIMDKIAGEAKNIELKIVLRDENLELMDAFLTHGSRSIPKLIILDKKKGQIVGEWGPRPSAATEMRGIQEGTRETDRCLQTGASSLVQQGQGQEHPRRYPAATCSGIDR